MYSFITCKKSQSFPSEEHTFVSTKFKMAAKRHVDVVIPELFDIYFNLISHFHMSFNAEFLSKIISKF